MMKIIKFKLYSVNFVKKIMRDYLLYNISRRQHHQHSNTWRVLFHFYLFFCCSLIISALHTYTLSFSTHSKTLLTLCESDD